MHSYLHVINTDASAINRKASQERNTGVVQHCDEYIKKRRISDPDQQQFMGNALSQLKNMKQFNGGTKNKRGAATVYQMQDAYL